MSQWTQVSGAIRIDSFHIDETMGDVQDAVEIKKRLGKTVTYEDWQEPDSNCTPTGSEGGLHYEYILNSRLSDGMMNRGTILIYGSLRDYGGIEGGEYYKNNPNYKEILNWLNRALGGEEMVGIHIRQGVVEIEVEGGNSTKTYLFRFDSKTNLFVEHYLGETPY